MRVVLMEDVKNLGKKWDVIEVKRGYAVNYLIPKKLAVEAKPHILKEIERRREIERRKYHKEKDAAQKLAEEINKITLTFIKKAGEGGKLFGSLTAQEIAETLKNKLKAEITKQMILLEEPIKELGTFHVEVKLHSEVIAKVKVKIEPEKETK